MADPVTGAPVTDPALNPGLTPPGNILGDIPAPDPAAPPAGDPPAGDPAAPPAGDPPAGEPPKEEEPPKAEPRAPETYADFTIPEGLTLDEAGMTEFQTLAKEQDLTQEQAQKLLEFGGEKIKAMTEAPYRVWHEMQAAWQAEIKADPEIGGTQLDDTIRAAAELYKISPSNPYVKTQAEVDALKTALNTTGVGNHPAMVRLFARIGATLREPASTTGKPVPQSKNILDSLYPSMSKKDE